MFLEIPYDVSAAAGDVQVPRSWSFRLSQSAAQLPRTNQLRGYKIKSSFNTRPNARNGLGRDVIATRVDLLVIRIKSCARQINLD